MVVIVPTAHNSSGRGSDAQDDICGNDCEQRRMQAADKDEEN
jgi:hypothetical protein